MSRDETRHDPETVALGLAKVAEIRAQLAERNPNVTRRHTTESGLSPTLSAAPPPSPPMIDEHTILDEWSAEKISAEMAAGSERDQLQARVDRLESEVSQLRSALAAVLNAAAAGLNDSTDESVAKTPLQDRRQ